jgi:hypothetical protein
MEPLKQKMNENKTININTTKSKENSNEFNESRNPESQVKNPEQKNKTNIDTIHFC